LFIAGVNNTGVGTPTGKGKRNSIKTVRSTEPHVSVPSKCDVQTANENQILLLPEGT
jgi:hypothetical protein